MVFPFGSSKVKFTQVGNNKKRKLSSSDGATAAKGLKRVPQDMKDELTNLWDELLPGDERPSNKKNRGLRPIDIPISKEKFRRFIQHALVFCFQEQLVKEKVILHFEAMIQWLSKNRKATVTYEEVALLMIGELKATDCEQLVINSFQADWAMENAQFLSPFLLKNLFKNLGETMSDKQWDKLVQNCNCGGPDKISYTDFVDIYNYYEKEKDRRAREAKKKSKKPAKVKPTELGEEEEDRTVAIKMFLADRDDPSSMSVSECNICLELSGVYRPKLKQFICAHCLELANERKKKLEEEIAAAIAAAAAAKALEQGARPGSSGFDGDPMDLALAEANECRICLEEAFRRKCCKSYYCDKCFFRSKFCPGCDAPNDSKMEQDLGKKPPTIPRILAGCGLTLTALGIFVATLALFTYSYISHPETIFGQRCWGWLPQCNLLHCIDVSGRFDDGPDKLADWKHCTMNSTEKIYGQTCLYDWSLYFQTGKRMGFDFCEGPVAQGQQQMWDGREFGDGASFPGGAVVFEDSFEDWYDMENYDINMDIKFNTEDGPKSHMKSARWDRIFNARSTGACGSFRSNEIRPNTMEYSSDFQALVLSGSEFRYAVTEQIDLRNGGFMNFYIKYQPALGNEASSNCKAAYTGDLTVAYSIDNGKSYSDLATYVVADYQKEWFTFVSEQLPERVKKAHKSENTTGTRFKFYQKTFDESRDYVAVDDIRVFHNFKDDWDKSALFNERYSQSQEDIEMAQCCFGTDYCETKGFNAAEPDGLTTDSFTTCDDIFSYTEVSAPGPDGRRRFILMGAKYYTVLIFLSWVFKAFYADVLIPTIIEGPIHFVPDWLIKMIREYQHGPDPVDEDDDDDKYFALIIDYDWQRKWLFVVLLPFFAFAYLVSESLEDISLYLPLHFNRGTTSDWQKFHEYPEFSNFAIFVFAVVIDSHQIYHVARYNICVLKCWWPKMWADTSPNVNSFFFGSNILHPKVVELGDIKEFSRFTEAWCNYLAFNYVAMCMPYALIGLYLDSLKWEMIHDYGVAPFLATFTGFRLVFGTEMFIKLYFFLPFFCGNKGKTREDVAEALFHRRSGLWMVTFGFVVTTLVCFGMIMGVSGNQRTNDEFFIWACTAIALFLSSVTGLITGVFFWSPSTPNFFLTSLGEGQYMTYYHKRTCTRFPLDLLNRFCQDMHSQEVRMVVYPEDIVRTYFWMRFDSLFVRIFLSFAFIFGTNEPTHLHLAMYKTNEPTNGCDRLFN